MPTAIRITPRFWLDTPAAASWGRMAAAGMPTGGITDAGRVPAEQIALFLARYEPRKAGGGPFGDVRWWRGTRYVRMRGASAAVPGTSNHETGRAVDLYGATLAWVRAHGAPYGWIKDRVRGEKWHVEYLAARDTRAHETPRPGTHATATPASPAAPVAERRRTVRILHDSGRNNWFRAGEVTIVQLTNAGQVATDLEVWGPAVEVDYTDVEEQVRRTATAQNVLATLFAHAVGMRITAAITALDVDTSATAPGASAAEVADEMDRRARLRLGA